MNEIESGYIGHLIAIFICDSKKRKEGYGMDSQKKKYKVIKANTSLNKDQIIALMEIYLDEWQHRDSLLWAQVFKLFYADLIVIVLPNIAEFLGIVLPPINQKVFPLIGIFMAIMFLYMGIGYAIRLRASSRTYEKLMKHLGNEEFERISIKDKSKIKFGWMFAPPLAMLLVVTMFISLIAASIVLLVL